MAKDGDRTGVPTASNLTLDRQQGGGGQTLTPSQGHEPRTLDSWILAALVTVISILLYQGYQINGVRNEQEALASQLLKEKHSPAPSYTYHCEKFRDLVVEVPDTALTASSYIQQSSSTGNHPPHAARLHSNIDAGGWISETNDHQWIQVEFNTTKTILGIQTQGRPYVAHPEAQHWVKTYALMYSTDGDMWATVTGSNGKPKMYRGNEDTDSVVTNSWFMEGHPAIRAKFIRIYPQTHNKYPGFRFGVIGCD